MADDLGGGFTTADINKHLLGARNALGETEDAGSAAIAHALMALTLEVRVLRTEATTARILATTAARVAKPVVLATIRMAADLLQRDEQGKTELRVRRW